MSASRLGITDRFKTLAPAPPQPVSGKTPMRNGQPRAVEAETPLQRPPCPGKPRLGSPTRSGPQKGPVMPSEDASAAPEPVLQPITAADIEARHDEVLAKLADLIAELDRTIKDAGRPRDVKRPAA